MNDGAIIGAGIAGLGAGIFAQKYGIHLPIYEKNEKSNCGHHLMWIAPNGLHLLNTMGLLEQVQTLSVSQGNMLFTTKYLRPLMTLDGGQLAQACQFPIMVIKRQDLWDLLFNKFVSAGGKIYFEQKLRNLQVQDNGLNLKFHNQSEPVFHSYIIGADGMGSSVRSHFFPESIVSYQGIRTWLGDSMSSVADKYVGNTIEAWGDNGTRFVLTSLDGQTVYWSALERFSQYEKNTSEVPVFIIEKLKKNFADYHSDIHSILAASNQTHIKRSNFGVVSGLKSYSRGRVVLIGDAAHGMSPNMGIGASLGLEDALNVIQQIVSCANLEESFQLYSRLALSRARPFVRMANSMNILFQPESKLASVVRNSVAALIPDLLTQRRMEKLYNQYQRRNNK